MPFAAHSAFLRSTRAWVTVGMRLSMNKPPFGRLFFYVPAPMSWRNSPTTRP